MIRALQSRRTVDIDHRHDYFIVRARSTGAIAVYAHDDRVAICVAPERGYALERQEPFRHQLPRTAVTSYVIVSEEGVRDYFGAVRDLAAESVDWRATGRTLAFCVRCGVGCPRQRDACPDCWTEVDDNGACLCPGGPAVAGMN